MSDRQLAKANDINFENEIILNKEPALVFFVADWCMTSRLAAPRFEAFAQRFRELRTFVVDVDKAPVISCQYQVDTLPTSILFIDGQPRYYHRGMINNVELEELAQKVPNQDELI